MSSHLLTQTDLTLETEAAALVTALGGVWHSGGAMCRCPAHDDRTPSLSIRVGATSLLFKCFAGCDTSDVLRAIRRLRLAVPNRPGDGPPPSNALRDEKLSDRAREIWDIAQPIGGSLADRYLESRGLAGNSPALRFHPRTPLGRGRAVRFRPALIAAVNEATRIVAIQRIFLDPESAGLAPDLVRPKRMLGRPLGGAVRLQACGDTLGLAEGVETALSAHMLLGIPVWATLGNERLARVRLPASVTRLVLLADNDAAGRRAAAAAGAAHMVPGRTIEARWPPHGLNDWNDALGQEGKGAGGRVR